MLLLVRRIHLRGEHTAKEQLELFQLCRDLATTDGKALSRVIVIHNLRGVQTSHDLDASLEELKRIYGATGGQSGCQLQPEDVDVDGRTETIRYLKGFRGHGERQNTFLECQQHFIMGQDGTPAGRLNAHVIHKIKSILLAVTTHRRSFNFQSMVLDNAEQLLPKYFKIPPGFTTRVERSRDPPICKAVAYDESGNPAADVLELKHLELGAFVCIDSVASIASAPYSIFESDSEVWLVIELPGVSKGAVKTTLLPEGNRVRVKVEARREKPKTPLFERPTQRPIQFESSITIDMAVDPGKRRFTTPKRPTKPEGHDSHLHDGLLTFIWAKDDGEEVDIPM